MSYHAPYFHSQGNMYDQYPYRFIMLGQAHRNGVFEDVCAWLDAHVDGQMCATNALGDVFMVREEDAFAFKLRWC